MVSTIFTASVSTPISCISNILTGNPAAEFFDGFHCHKTYKIFIVDAPFVIFSVELDCVEFAACGAETAAYADVLVYHSGTAAQTA